MIVSQITQVGDSSTFAELTEETKFLKLLSTLTRFYTNFLADLKKELLRNPKIPDPALYYEG